MQRTQDFPVELHTQLRVFSVAWILSSCLFVNTVVQAQPVEVALGISEIAAEYNDHLRPVVALTGGGFATVWMEQTPDLQVVRRQIVDSLGNHQLEPQGRLVDIEGASIINNAALVADFDGGLFISVHVFGQPSITRVQKFDAEGNPQWPDWRPALQAISLAPAFLQPDEQGGLFTCARETVGQGRIFCQYLNSTGEAQWGDLGLEVGGRDGWRVQPTGILANDGSLMVFWQNNGWSGSPPAETIRIEGQRFGIDGEKLWGEDGLTVHTTRLPETAFATLPLLRVAPDDHGGAIVAFMDAVDPTSASVGIGAQRVSPEGSLLWAADIDVMGPGDHALEDAISDGSGGIIVASRRWKSDHYELDLARLDVDSNLLWPQDPLPFPNPGASAYSAKLSLRNGFALVAWTQQLALDSPEIDVWHAEVDLAGTAGLPSAATTAPNAQFLRGLADGPNGWMAVWEDLRRDDWQTRDFYGATGKRQGLLYDGFESGDTSAWNVD